MRKWEEERQRRWKDTRPFGTNVKTPHWLASIEPRCSYSGGKTLISDTHVCESQTPSNLKNRLIPIVCCQPPCFLLYPSLHICSCLRSQVKRNLLKSPVWEGWNLPVFLRGVSAPLKLAECCMAAKSTLVVLQLLPQSSKTDTITRHGLRWFNRFSHPEGQVKT